VCVTEENGRTKPGPGLVETVSGLQQRSAMVATSCEEHFSGLDLTPKPIPFFEPYAWSTRDVFHSLPGAAPCIHATQGTSRHPEASLVSRWGDDDCIFTPQ